jgi:hypothetical protein
MIEFKKRFKKILPYNRQHYIEYLDNDFDSPVEWNGVSFQLNRKNEAIDLIEFVKNYESLFKKVVSKFGNDSIWIVNHDDKDMKWFPNDDDNLISLRTLFKQRNVPNTYRGALIFKKDDLLKFSKDLISYPYALFFKDNSLYKNLDISHSELQFIIKISGHLTIDFLSTDKMLLRNIISENGTQAFIIKEYRGTNILR